MVTLYGSFANRLSVEFMIMCLIHYRPLKGLRYLYTYIMTVSIAFAYRDNRGPHNPNIIKADVGASDGWHFTPCD